MDINTVDATEASLVPVISEVKHYTIDPVTGERTEIPAPVLVHGQEGEGPVATEYVDA